MLPFDSERRYMATLHRDPDGSARLYVKGAVEQVLGMCERSLRSDGRVMALDRRAILQAVEELGKQTSCVNPRAG